MTSTVLSDRVIREAYGRPDPVRVYDDEVKKHSLEERHAKLDRAAQWGRIGVAGALAFTVGLLMWNLRIWGWWNAFRFSFLVVIFIAGAFVAIKYSAPWVRRGARFIDHWVRVGAWWWGFIDVPQPRWIPPLPNVPLPGTAVILPWHSWPTAGGIIVRRTRVARPVTTVLFYDDHHVAAIGHIREIRSESPRDVARRYGAKVGMASDVFRKYTAGRRKVCVIELDAAWSINPFTLDSVGITGPVGSHRYLGGGRS